MVGAQIDCAGIYGSTNRPYSLYGLSRSVDWMFDINNEVLVSGQREAFECSCVAYVFPVDMYFVYCSRWIPYSNNRNIIREDL